VVILAQDTVNPSDPTGGDFFRGGASHVELYRASGETQVYASFFDYGVFRRSMTQDGDNRFPPDLPISAASRRSGYFPFFSTTRPAL